MTTEEFELKMKAHEQNFNLLMDEINKDVIQFADANKNITNYEWNFYLVITEKFIDNICSSGAWIKDRINNQLGSKKGLKYKIRKVLGYTYP